jgi:hypothetical protein
VKVKRKMSDKATQPLQYCGHNEHQTDAATGVTDADPLATTTPVYEDSGANLSQSLKFE